MTQHTPLPPAEAQHRLVCRCQDHLRHEEAQLRTLVDSLRQLRTACLAGRLDDLNEVIQRHSQLQQMDDPLAQERDQLRQELASFLGVPLPRVNLTCLLRSLPGQLQEQLEPLSARLRNLLKEAEQLSRHNAALLNYSLSFLQRLFHGIDGGCGVERYGPRGRREESMFGNLLKVRRG